MFDDVKQRLEALGLIMHGGTIVDATIIHAPRSTKNATKSRDPEMHSTKKGNQWYFGMSIHSGADAGTGYVHTITATAANVHDIAKAHELVREDDHTVYGDSGYLGVQKRTEIRENTDLSGVDYRIAKRPSQNRMTKAYKGMNWERQIKHAKASVRSKVEHPFLIVKRLFHAGKTRYQKEPSAILSALCVGKSRDVSAGGKAERILHDNGISAPIFPMKREIREEKGAVGGGVARCFSLQFVKFVPVDHVAMMIRY